MLDMLFMYAKAFVVGGLICALGQILILKTQLTSARILVGYVTTGVILGALGVYKPVIDFAGAGATVPLTGFGYALAHGAMEAVETSGILGAFTGGVASAAGGIAAAVFFGYLAAILFKPRMKA
ncbi:MAG TPA: stage V sporulation protein AE [Candidatus Ventricola gallistercoris]|nr:stage V sporulation protein AE [Candidatus Ventricola gallistercoris]